jgi:hypothetical protein
MNVVVQFGYLETIFWSCNEGDVLEYSRQYRRCWASHIMEEGLAFYKLNYLKRVSLYVSHGMLQQDWECY